MEQKDCDYCLTETSECLAGCQCPECFNEHEVAKDREFDEKVALGYI